MGWKEDYKCDLYRKTGSHSESHSDKKCFELRLMKLFRKAHDAYQKYKAKQSLINIVGYYFSRRKWLVFCNVHSINIPPATNIGPGFFIGHNGPIAINPRASIGQNCNIGICVTIGQENRGTRKGSPTIGNDVWIGSNAVIVGKIKVGDNVLIAPGAYVNFDVPSNSIVLGNPGKIIPSEHATADYINNRI